MIFPLNPLPQPNQASWKLFPLGYFPEKQFSDDDDNDNNDVIFMEQGYALSYVKSFDMFSHLILNLRKYGHVFTFSK